MSCDGGVGGMITCVGLAYILVGWGGYLPTDELRWGGGWDDRHPRPESIHKHVKENYGFWGIVCTRSAEHGPMEAPETFICNMHANLQANNAHNEIPTSFKIRECEKHSRMTKQCRCHAT